MVISNKKLKADAKIGDVNIEKVNIYNYFGSKISSRGNTQYIIREVCGAQGNKCQCYCTEDGKPAEKDTRSRFKYFGRVRRTKMRIYGRNYEYNF